MTISTYNFAGSRFISVSVSSSPVGIIATVGFLNTSILRMFTLDRNAISCALRMLPFRNILVPILTSVPVAETKDPFGKDLKIST